MIEKVPSAKAQHIARERPQRRASPHTAILVRATQPPTIPDNLVAHANNDTAPDNIVTYNKYTASNNYCPAQQECSHLVPYNAAASTGTAPAIPCRSTDRGPVGAHQAANRWPASAQSPPETVRCCRLGRDGAAPTLQISLAG